MDEGTTYIAPIPSWLESGDPSFHMVATLIWCNMARSREATVELTSIHRHNIGHIADVVLNGVPYLLDTTRVNGKQYVTAFPESAVSGRSSDKNDNVR